MFSPYWPFSANAENGLDTHENRLGRYFHFQAKSKITKRPACGVQLPRSGAAAWIAPRHRS
jgi:hypothetical protein